MIQRFVKRDEFRRLCDYSVRHSQPLNHFATNLKERP